MAGVRTEGGSAGSSPFNRCSHCPAPHRQPLSLSGVFEMFRSTAAAAPPVEEVAPSSLVALSLLRLEMDPGDDWSPYLAERDVPVLTDAIGRDSVLLSDARGLLDEHRARLAAEREAAARKREALEAELVE